MKKGLVILIVVLVINFSLFAEIVGEIIAKVGREIILQSDLDKRIQQIDAAGMFSPEITKSDILNDMIESEIILQKAKQEEYEIDEEQIKAMAESQIKQIASQFPSEFEFKKELRSTGLTVLDLKEYYTQMITEQTLKEKIIQNKIKNKIHITEVEVEDYYNEHKDEIPPRPAMDQIGMIKRTIKPGKETNNKALAEINKLRDKLIEGADFTEIAKERSDCPSGASGGDLGFFGRGTMVKTFEETAFNLMPGEISEVIKTDFGYHIIKVDEKREDEVKASHILKKIEQTEEDVQATIKLMENLLDRLNKGEDFFEIAKTYSEDDSTAVKGGIIGEFPSNNYPEFYKEYFEGIGYGEYSSLIREENDIYIFAKLKQITERPYRYEELYDKLRELVISKKEMQLYENWIKELIQETYIEILLEE
ncbi:MAG: peptidylprolyl isomerase [Candidatus Cloacimonetes bacterium]|nr:peptidylprolyl isomerase [Candidatus Cloacimonadota bacterium]